MADFLNALINGAASQWDQAKWIGNRLSNGRDYPQPALYDGGKDYPAKNDANAYVRNNWPSEDGLHGLVGTRPDTFYTPHGAPVPPSGRGPYIGEDMAGAPTLSQLVPFLSLLMKQRQGGQR